MKTPTNFQRLFLCAGAMSAGIAVILGAFAAHALKTRLTPDFLDAFKTGVHYQTIHALALILCGILLFILPAPAHRFVIRGGIFFAVGSVLFSGSLYALTLTEVRAFGAITPLGGLSFIVGWIFVFRACRFANFK